MASSLVHSHQAAGSLKKYSGLVTRDAEKWSEMLGDNSDVRVSELERLFHAALKLEADRHQPARLPIHVALPPLEIRLEYSLTNLAGTFFSQAL